jgi:hypothetical protein
LNEKILPEAIWFSACFSNGRRISPFPAAGSPFTSLAECPDLADIYSHAACFFKNHDIEPPAGDQPEPAAF